MKGKPMQPQCLAQCPLSDIDDKTLHFPFNYTTSHSATNKNLDDHNHINKSISENWNPVERAPRKSNFKGENKNICEPWQSEKDSIVSQEGGRGKGDRKK